MVNEEKRVDIRKVIECVVITFVIGYGVHYLGYFLRNRYYNFIDALQLSEGVAHVFTYAGHGVYLILWLIYAWAVKRDRGYILSFVPRGKSKSLLWLVLGLFVGLALMGICLFAASINGDITINFRDNNKGIYGIIAGGFLAVLLQASTEEIESRGFVFGKMKAEGVPVTVAVAVSAFFFGYLHMANPGFGLIPLLSIFTVGCFYALSYHYIGNLWFSCGTHAMWNFTQDFLFGLPDSGNPAAVSVMDTVVNGGSFFYSPEFGIEGSWMTICMNCVACVAVVLIGERYRKKVKSDGSGIVVDFVK